MNEMTRKESEGLVKKIAEIVGRAKLPSDACRAHFDEIDFQGKDAAQRGNHREALIKRAQAAVIYFDSRCYYEAANSADRAENASHMLQLKANNKRMELTLEERELVSSEAYLGELAGNCYLEIGEKENAVFAYLKSAKGYVFDFSDIEKTEEMLERARELDVGINVLIKNKTAIRMYEDAMCKQPSPKGLGVTTLKLI